eukprot:2034598-Heterocapsa_arctica.AAC.1
MSLMWRIARRLAAGWSIGGDVDPLAAPAAAAVADIGRAADRDEGVRLLVKKLKLSNYVDQTD